MYVVSRQLERIGDHAVDIGEQVAFLVTGQFREFTDASHPEIEHPALVDLGDAAQAASWRQDWRTEPCPTRGHAGPGLRLLEPERRPLDHDDPHRPDTAGLLPAEGRAKNASLGP